MNSFVVLISLCQVIFLHLPRAHTQKYSLDGYCFSQLPKMKKDAGYLSVLKLIQICSDLETYAACIKTTRLAPNKAVNIQEFEKVFPADDDTDRGGYLFCMLTLLKDPDLYNVSPKKFASCKSQVNESKCVAATEDVYKLVGHAMDLRDERVRKTTSCMAYVLYWICMREQYSDCDRDTYYMFDYYLARAGEKCLNASETFNRVLFAMTCDGVRVTRPPLVPDFQYTPATPNSTFPFVIFTTNKPRNHGVDSSYHSLLVAALVTPATTACWCCRFWCC